MQAALDSGRVYLRHPGGPANLRHFFGWQTDTELCKQQGTISLDCYYESWSSCTLEDALGKENAKMPNPLSKIEIYRPNEKVIPFLTHLYHILLSHSFVSYTSTLHTFLVTSI